MTLSRTEKLLATIDKLEKRELKLRDALLLTRVAWAKDIFRPLMEIGAHEDDLAIALIIAMPGLKRGMALSVQKMASKHLATEVPRPS